MTLVVVIWLMLAKSKAGISWVKALAYPMRSGLYKSKHVLLQSHSITIVVSSCFEREIFKGEHSNTTITRVLVMITAAVSEQLIAISCRLERLKKLFAQVK